MLEYTKLILEKVSFDRKLFEKELRKALAYLTGDERMSLKGWCWSKFGPRYQRVVNKYLGKPSKGANV
ncbi:MAG: hypothetical protein H7Z75_19035 [Ferruginibacter sp.]|nr:hypothetical protein [Cytophagales bacterium]